MAMINSAKFVKGIRARDDILYDGIPEVAFIGRSNVGKSSVINVLVGQKDLVKVGKKPGKTKEINFFSINDNGCYFVDLPGYGFAKASLEEREYIRRLILWYLTESNVIPHAVVLIIDAKVGATSLDLEMFDILKRKNHHCIVVANKIDKLGIQNKERQLNVIKKELNDVDVIAYSATTKEGRQALLEKIF